MLMTEEEARTKWCPMALVAIQNVASDMAVLTGSSPIHQVGNRATLIAGRERLCDTATGSRCIASECMAWRWGRQHTRQTETMLVADLELEGCRTRNALDAAGIKFVSELQGYTDNELLRFPNFGRKCLADVHRALKDIANPLERRGFCGHFGKPEA